VWLASFSEIGTREEWAEVDLDTFALIVRESL
jgi:hypothetical protein